ncbi:AraC family transcriptional regulator [Paenibacillus sp. MMS20-IR301]|uniref:helix-turn-helix transcriptional regulator n=1 Tax=Paenibacillus sp. MMS20-IR301 TaxID=2895946 RepID=UPI0028E99A30|nr:AraC family transcriptional regulator [Paenibacillus sp. MMS20-IR301]WNS44194.1 AraC family transcriptional regulator [Paenibacillus sp. MMS20-IR301]
MIEILNGAKETVSYREHFGIRIYLNREADNYPIHWHTAAEVIMPLENTYSAVVDDTQIVLNPGDILIIPPGELHQLFAPETGRRIIMQFDCTLLYHLNGLDSTFHLLRPYITITPQQGKDLHGALKPLLIELTEEYFSPSLLKEASAYAMLIQFFVILGRNFMGLERRFPHRKNQQQQHKYIDKLLEVCNYINDHCTEEIQVETLAELAGFSKFHFMRLFKQFMGMSYYNYLNEHRIMFAEKLLIDPNLSIIEVAMSSGFGSLPTFNRVFKSYKKCTPSEYKLLHGVHKPLD